MKKNTNKLVEKTINEIKGLEKLLKESYNFEDEGGEYSEDEMIGDETSGNDETLGNDDNMGNDLSQKDDRIARIREVALEGLQEYAEDVDSDFYQFFKKIWLMCDKAVSDRETV